jgi:hypothetical protein
MNGSFSTNLWSSSQSELDRKLETNTVPSRPVPYLSNIPEGSGQPHSPAILFPTVSTVYEAGWAPEGNHYKDPTENRNPSFQSAAHDFTDRNLTVHMKLRYCIHITDLHIMFLFELRY